MFIEENLTVHTVMRWVVLKCRNTNSKSCSVLFRQKKKGTAVVQSCLYKLHCYIQISSAKLYLERENMHITLQYLQPEQFSIVCKPSCEGRALPLIIQLKVLTARVSSRHIFSPLATYTC